ncbi:MAG: protein kinase [Clostridiales bacterium]|nr:protein kinase [Clostridiales bacterium]
MPEEYIELCPYCFSQLVDGMCISCDTEPQRNIVALPLGTILHGRYHIGRVLGKGGFGITYLALDMETYTRVAIKEFFPDYMVHRNEGSPTVYLSSIENEAVYLSGAEKYYNEALLLSKFRTVESVVNVYEFFYENNTVYYTMEYLEGMDLKTYIQRCNGKIPQSEIVYLAQQISDALIQIHSTGFLHRDISPDNICICENGQIKLIDFGSARQVLGKESKSLSVILKQGFAPVEQYQTHGNQGPWTDLYALGATLYFAGTGILIPDASSRATDEALDFSMFSVPIAEILESLLRVRASDRMQSALELRSRLDNSGIIATPISLANILPLNDDGADSPTSSGSVISNPKTTVNFKKKRYVRKHRKATLKAIMPCVAGAAIQAIVLAIFFITAPKTVAVLWVAEILVTIAAIAGGVSVCRKFIHQRSNDEYRRFRKEPEIRLSNVFRAVGFILCIFVCVGTILTGVKSYDKIQYSKGKKLVDAKLYEKATSHLKEAVNYGDAQTLIKKCAYLMADDLMQNKDYLNAIEQFKQAGDYEDAADKINGCKYLYAAENKDDETSEQFLSELAQIKYKDSSELYAKLTSWSVTITAASSDDFEHDNDKLNIYGYIFFNFIVNGGKSGETLKVRVEVTDTEGKKTIEKYDEAFHRGHKESYYLGYNYPNIGNVKPGKMTVNIFDADKNTLLGTKTVELTYTGSFAVKVISDSFIFSSASNNTEALGQAKVGDEFIVEKIANGYGYVPYKNSAGWILLSDTERS